MINRAGLLISPGALNATGGAAAPGLPLDLIPGAAVGYSYRKLRAAYAGAPATIEREDTLAFQDVGFVGNDFDAATYTSFIAGTTGHTRKWYDQSNANDEAANLATALPVTFSHVPQDNGRYGGFTTAQSGSYMSAADAVNMQNIWATGGFAAIVFRVESIPATFGSPMLAKGTTAGWEIFIYNNNGPYQVLLYLKASTTDGNTWASNSISLSTLHLLTVAWNASTPATPATITLDGVVCGLNSSATPVGTFASDAGQPLVLFNDNVLDTLNNGFGGGLYEVMLWKSIPSVPNQAALVSGIKAYYGIP
jgi:hypothetical protein